METLVCVCTICLRPTKRTLCLYGLNSPRECVGFLIRLFSGNFFNRRNRYLIYHLNCILIISNFWFNCQSSLDILKLNRRRCYMSIQSYSGPGVIKLFSASTQLSAKFQLLIKSKIRTNEDVSCLKSLRCCIYHAKKC